MLDARADQQLVFHQHYSRLLRGRVQALLTEELIEAHRRAPHGPHGDAMMRVLVYFGAVSPYALYAPKPLARYHIVRLPGSPGATPQRIDAHEFEDLGAARHAVFLLNVADLRRQEAA